MAVHKNIVRGDAAAAAGKPARPSFFDAAVFFRDTIDGVEVNPDLDALSNFLCLDGIEIISPRRGILDSDYTPVAKIEHRLQEMFPDGGVNENDLTFAVEKDGYETLVFEHAGQMFCSSWLYDRETDMFHIVGRFNTLDINKIRSQLDGALTVACCGARKTEEVITGELARQFVTPTKWTGEILLEVDGWPEFKRLLFRKFDWGTGYYAGLSGGDTIPVSKLGIGRSLKLLESVRKYNEYSAMQRPDVPDLYRCDRVLVLLNDTADYIAERRGMNVDYCTSMDMSLFPTVVLAMAGREFDEPWVSVEEDLRFLAENGRFLPKEYAEASLPEIRKYLLDHREEVLGEIEKDCNRYLGLNKDYVIVNNPDVVRPSDDVIFKYVLKHFFKRSAWYVNPETCELLLKNCNYPIPAEGLAVVAVGEEFAVMPAKVFHENYNVKYDKTLERTVCVRKDVPKKKKIDKPVRKPSGPKI